MVDSKEIAKEISKTSFFGKYLSRPISYFVFIFWSVVTIAPLIWMGYSSFKTNAELTKDIFSLPEFLMGGSTAEYDVYYPDRQVTKYPASLMKKYGLKATEFEKINEYILILYSPEINSTLPTKDHFFDRAKLSGELKELTALPKTIRPVGQRVTVKASDLPFSVRTKLGWETFWWNYTSAWERGSLGLKFVNSIIYTICSTFFVIILGLMLGYGITKFKYKKIAAIVSALIALGYLLDVNQVIVPLFLMLTKLGLTNTHIGVILVYTAFGLPMAVMLSSTFIKGLPDSVVESAYIDGASPFRTFMSIVIPMTIPVIVTISIMTALGIWNEFLLVLVLASAEKTVSLPVGIFSFSSRTGMQLGWQVASLIIATLPVLIVYIIFQKRLAEGVAGGALKE